MAPTEDKLKKSSKDKSEKKPDKVGPAAAARAAEGWARRAACHHRNSGCWAAWPLHHPARPPTPRSPPPPPPPPLLPNARRRCCLVGPQEKKDKGEKKEKKEKSEKKDKDKPEKKDKGERRAMGLVQAGGRLAAGGCCATLCRCRTAAQRGMLSPLLWWRSWLFSIQQATRRRRRAPATSWLSTRCRPMASTAARLRGRPTARRPPSPRRRRAPRRAARPSRSRRCHPGGTCAGRPQLLL